jgi:hypothetical protein
MKYENFGNKKAPEEQALTRLTNPVRFALSRLAKVWCCAPHQQDADGEVEMGTTRGDEHRSLLGLPAWH